MFQMNKALSKHIWPLTGEDENVKQKGKCEDSHDSGNEGDNKGEEEEEQEEEEEAEEEEVKKESNARSKKGRWMKMLRKEEAALLNCAVFLLNFKSLLVFLNWPELGL